MADRVPLMEIGKLRARVGELTARHGAPPWSEALVMTDDWWLYNAGLAALNCARLPDCPVVFALALTPADQERLRVQYPDRPALRTVDNAAHIRLAPVSSS